MLQPGYVGGVALTPPGSGRDAVEQVTISSYSFEGRGEGVFVCFWFPKKRKKHPVQTYRLYNKRTVAYDARWVAPYGKKKKLGSAYAALGQSSAARSCSVCNRTYTAYRNYICLEWQGLPHSSGRSKKPPRRNRGVADYMPPSPAAWSGCWIGLRVFSPFLQSTISCCLK